MIKPVLLFFSIAFLFYGCKQEDLTPSWIKIDAFDLVTNEETQGWDTHSKHKVQPNALDVTTSSTKENNIENARVRNHDWK